MRREPNGCCATDCFRSHGLDDAAVRVLECPDDARQHGRADPDRGSSWIDNLRRLGREPIGIHFAGKATDPRYDNKRTEMYFEAVDWIRKGGALPADTSQELIAALTRTTYSFRGDRLLLEPKDQVKALTEYDPLA